MHMVVNKIMTSKLENKAFSAKSVQYDMYIYNE